MTQEDALLDMARITLERHRQLLDSEAELGALRESRLRSAARLAWLQLAAAGGGGPAGSALPGLAADLLKLDRRMRVRIDRCKDEVNRLRAALDAAEAGFPPAAGLSAARLATLDYVCRLNEVVVGRGAFVLTDQDTGAAGRSDLRYVLVYHDQPNPQFPPRYLIAKFDDPERAAREWRVVGELRPLPLPPQVILPDPAAHPDDGVILFAEARTGPDAPTVKLAAYLRKYLWAGPRTCDNCLGRAIEHLAAFHTVHPGRRRGTRPDSSRLRWGDVLPEAWSMLLVGASGEFGAVCRKVHETIDWADHAPLTSGAAGGATPPDPVSRLDEMLAANPGGLRLSRVHGDLNLGNLLVTHYAEGTHREVFVIDLANSEPNRATALDFARLEVALWHEVFLHPDRCPGAAGGAALLADMVAVHTNLSGWAAVAYQNPETASFADLVAALRHRAYLRLAPAADEPGRAEYVLEDYFHALYFTFLSLLQYRGVSDDARRAPALVVGAALALQVIDAAGRYNHTATDPLARPWEAPPAW